MNTAIFEFPTILVIDVGGTGVKFGYTIDGTPQSYSRRFSTDQLRNEDPIISLASMISAVTKESGLKPELIVSTVPGFLDTDEDRVLYAGNILTLNGRKLATELSELVNIPVILERDSVLALSGEAIAGCAQSCNRILGIFFGTGVGAAFIEDGKPFRGAGWALELGLMPFKGEGKTLEGMRTDVMEAYVSGRVLQEIASRHAVPIESVFSRVSSDPVLKVEIDDFVKNQAFAVGTAIALFSPEVIVVGGGLCAMESFPKERLVELIYQNAPIRETGRELDLRWASLGWQSSLYGAPNAARAHLIRHAADNVI